MTKCPYCGSEGPFMESDRGFSLWPELGKNVKLCMNCQGPFGVNTPEEDAWDRARERIKACLGMK